MFIRAAIPTVVGIRRTTLALTLLAFLPTSLGAQTQRPGVEVFALLTGVDLTSSVAESAGGLGIRVGYNLTDYVAIEADIAHFPENPSDNYGQTIALAGVRAGRRSGKYGS